MFFEEGWFLCVAQFFTAPSVKDPFEFEARVLYIHFFCASKALRLFLKGLDSMININNSWIVYTHFINEVNFSMIFPEFNFV